MTDLQIKYWLAKETERSNKANEQIKSKQVESQAAVNLVSIDKMIAEIDKIKADTKLSQAKKSQTISSIVMNWIQTLVAPLTAVGQGVAKGIGTSAGDIVGDYMLFAM